VISQCSIRHLYNSEHKSETLIDQAKTYERRRCNHHLLEEPLSTLDCLKSVVDSKDNLTNKHRYVIASQDGRLRAHLRQIPGVPMVYINRSVMIMEPMGGATELLRDREERLKFKTGLKSRHSSTLLGKRQRDDSESGDESPHRPEPDASAPSGSTVLPKRRKGPKGANPLSVKKPKGRAEPYRSLEDRLTGPGTKPVAIMEADANDEAAAKKKRKRRPKAKVEKETAGEAPSE
jgi:U3 small nucleolar RNA-associated protein 23